MLLLDLPWNINPCSSVGFFYIRLTIYVMANEWIYLAARLRPQYLFPAQVCQSFMSGIAIAHSPIRSMCSIQ